jgi:hypothetical protein
MGLSERVRLRTRTIGISYSETGLLLGAARTYKKKELNTPSPNSAPDAQMPLRVQIRLCAFWYGTGVGEVVPKPVATGGGGRWGPGDAREVGRLAACGPARGRRWPPYSVPGRMAHGVGISGAQVRGF